MNFINAIWKFIGNVIKTVIVVSLLLLVTVIGFGVVGYLASGDEVSIEMSPRQNQLYAYVVAEDYVKENLQYPDEAEVDAVSWYTTEEGELVVRCSVLANNAFGARKRSELHVVFSGKINEDKFDSFGQPYRIIE